MSPLQSASFGFSGRGKYPQVMEGTAVVTFSTAHPKTGSCLSKRVSFRKPVSLSFTNPGAERVILAVNMWWPVLQPALAAGQC